MEINAATITHDPTLAWRYAGIDTPPPDDLRTPTSISAVAARACLPHETARRRVERLIQLGRCVKVARGYMLTVEFLQAPEMLQAGFMCTQRTAQLIQQLRAAGIDLDSTPMRVTDQVA